MKGAQRGNALSQLHFLYFRCNTEQAGRPKCPVDPFFIMPDKVKCIDFQILKLQESPDSVPHGEMPRHMKLFVDRFLVDKVVPGNRVTVLGIYSIMKSSAQQGKCFRVKLYLISITRILITKSLSR